MNLWSNIDRWLVWLIMCRLFFFFLYMAKLHIDQAVTMDYVLVKILDLFFAFLSPSLLAVFFCAVSLLEDSRELCG